MTETLGVADAKRRFSELIDRVRAGERIIVTRHGKPAVVLVPPGSVSATSGPPTGYAALAGALADVEDFGDVMDDVLAARRSARDRAAPTLD